MIRGPITYTADSYRALPASAPRVELINGEFVEMTPSPSFAHQDAIGRLYALMLAHVEPEKLGKVVIAPIDVYLDRKNVLQPDIVFVASRNSSRLRADGIHGAPDLVVEALSPGTALRDLTVKRDLYKAASVAEYWLLDVEQQRVTVEVFGRGASRREFSGKDAVVGKTLTGFRPAVVQVFPGS